MNSCSSHASYALAGSSTTHGHPCCRTNPPPLRRRQTCPLDEHASQQTGLFNWCCMLPFACVFNVPDSLGVQIPDHALAHFVIAPYFTRHTCNSIQPHINSMRSRRPYRICFVGCIIKHNSYRNAPSPGFEARKTFIRHMNSSSTRIIDLCEQRHDRSPPQGLDSVYSQCDLCL